MHEYRALPAFIHSLHSLCASDFRAVCLQWETFDELRQRVEREWAALPPTADVLSAPLRAKRVAVAARLGVKGRET
jgi:hypothetical protein